MKRAVLIPVSLAVAVFAAACGGGGADEQSQSGAAAARTVDVDMVDIAFEPATLSANTGERIRFGFRNLGESVHDAFIGDRAAQDDHEREMRAAEKGGHGGGHGGDSEEEALTLKPGKTGALVYSFDRPGTVEIGCHQPGHYAAGMKITVTVT